MTRWPERMRWSPLRGCEHGLIAADRAATMLAVAGLPEAHLPAVPLSVADLEEAYGDAGLECTIRRFEVGPADKARDGYHGMAAVLARRPK